MNPKIEKLLKLPLYQRFGILGGVVILFVGIFTYLLIVPQFEELERLEGDLSRLESELVQKRQIADNLPKFKAEFAKMEKQLEKALTQLPNQAELPTLLTNLSTLAKDNGLEVKSFKPMKEVNKGFFAEVPTSLSLVGTYHQFALFAESVSGLSRIVNIGDLSLSSAKVDEGSAQLKIDCKVTTFRFVEQ